ncbi:MAG: CpsD/CapB family tyrosine-protein kinase [Clostridiales bacterium]|nr:CpsD/CapB family tyrosine-protein kinase [Clostridiales bacterium]
MSITLDMELLQEATGKRTEKSRRSAFDYILGDGTPFAVDEAYKALRTNVIFSLPGDGAKVIGITSSASGEGKSTAILNLAIAFGQIENKVLLIDCDLRLPTIAEKLGITGTPGLSDLLVGRSCRLRQLSDLGICVLPSGTLPPDATALLSSPKMGELLAEARKHFDYIFLDLPPVTTVADAAILAKHVDGFLLAIKHRGSRYGAIAHMLEQLALAGANVLGYVYTNAQVGGGHYRQYGYGYGYGYGHSYQK